ncbi:methyltransferase domain-containing protein [Alcaligenaceae bacterium]|nr:methyltransferase domain-containing protein [Alcaligenaceae bacterium]
MLKNSSLKVLYRQEQLPIFQNRMYDSPESAKSCPKGDVELVEDLRTGLVYNHAFRQELMVYDEHYQNEQGVSPLFQDHLECVACVVERCIGREAIVEVGCGKGYFLEMLLAKGFDVAGFDPTYEGNNPLVRRHYFESEVGIKANGLVLRHVLEHVQDPFAFLRSLKDANGGSGKIYIEVPCFDWICEHRAWFDVFYEHVNYFRLSDFYRIFGNVIEGGRLFGGQYLYVVAGLGSLQEPAYDIEDPVRFPVDFANNIETSSNNKNGKTVVWGGASKGVIFSLLKARTNQPVDVVIDINPAKQGKYLPGTGCLVHAPDDVLPVLPSGSTIYVMNSNYLSEIKNMSGSKFNYIGIDSRPCRARRKLRM